MNKFFFGLALCTGMLCSNAQAQTEDPVIMTINNQDVRRSEFEYSYNKNNTEGVIDKKTVKEYVDLFINYKLKVQAALDANLDTLSSYKTEYTGYRDQQVRPTLINEADVEAEAQRIYQNTKEKIGPDGLVKPAHILIRLQQNADNNAQLKAKTRADSVYNALMNGANFEELASRVSEDVRSAKTGGRIGEVAKGQTFKEFEDVVFALKDGEISKPVLSPVGYHVIKMISHEQLPPYDSLREDIHRFIEARSIRESIINNKLEEIVKTTGKTKEVIMDERADSLAAKDSDSKYLFQEYHDGLLLYEISNREVWEKAAKDTEGLKAYFKKNKKNYKWDEPHFKGIAYHTKEQADVEAVKRSIKGKKFDQWADILRSTFNSDSVLRIRVEKGVFKKGDNKLVDLEQFGENVEPKPVKGYPYDATFGTIINAPQEMEDVKSQVVADYQEYLEKGWVATLRDKYSFHVYENVLQTVNNH